MFHSYKFTIFITLSLHSLAMITNLVRGIREQSDMELEATLFKQFEKFMLEYKRTYDTTAEKMLRFGIFKNNLQEIERLNAESDGDVEYGVNPFSDLTYEEFTSNYLMSFRRGQLSKTLKSIQENPRYYPNAGIEKSTESKFDTTVKPAGSFDWRKNNEFYPYIDSQMPCGSCYAFATAGAIEIVVSKKLREVVKYSKQQIVDCSKNDKCEGGEFPPSLDYCKDPGLALESAYPYTADNETCTDQKVQAAIKIKTYARQDGDESILANLPTCPLIIAMNSKFKAFHNYKSGVLDPNPKDCDPENLTHAVIIIGYGTTRPKNNTIPAKKFWIVRNSWGEQFGENGHFRIRTGLCGIGTEVFKFTI